MDMWRVADEVITDLCEQPVPELERLRLHDVLTKWAHELEVNAEGRGFNEVRLAEAIVDRPGNYPDAIAGQVAALHKRYGCDDDEWP